MRRAGCEDVELLAELEKRAFAADGAWTSPQLLAELSAEKCEAWIAAEDAGYLLSWRVAGERELVRVAVDPAARRRGVGRRLVETLLEAARQAGDACVHLEVAQRNHAARALYTTAGFVEVGRRPAYYRSGDDALLMRHTL